MPRRASRSSHPCTTLCFKISAMHKKRTSLRIYTRNWAELWYTLFQRPNVTIKSTRLILLGPKLCQLRSTRICKDASPQHLLVTNLEFSHQTLRNQAICNWTTPLPKLQVLITKTSQLNALFSTKTKLLLRLGPQRSRLWQHQRQIEAQHSVVTVFSRRPFRVQKKMTAQSHKHDQIWLIPTLMLQLRNVPYQYRAMWVAQL